MSRPTASVSTSWVDPTMETRCLELATALTFWLLFFFRVYRRCRSRRRSAAWTSTRRWAAPIRCAWRPSTRRRRCCRPSPPPPPATSPSSSSAPPRDTWKRYVHRFSLLGYGAVAESHLVRCRGRGNVCEPFRPRKLFFLGTYLDISQCR